MAASIINPVALNLESKLGLLFSTTTPFLTISFNLFSIFLVFSALASILSTNGLIFVFSPVVAVETAVAISNETNPAIDAATAISFLYRCQSWIILDGAAAGVRVRKFSCVSLFSTSERRDFKFFFWLKFSSWFKKKICSTTAWSSSGLFFLRSSK